VRPSEDFGGVRLVMSRDGNEARNIKRVYRSMVRGEDRPHDLRFGFNCAVGYADTVCVASPVTSFPPPPSWPCLVRPGTSLDEKPVKVARKLRQEYWEV